MPVTEFLKNAVVLQQVRLPIANVELLHVFPNLVEAMQSNKENHRDTNIICLSRYEPKYQIHFGYGD